MQQPRTQERQASLEKEAQRGLSSCSGNWSLAPAAVQMQRPLKLKRQSLKQVRQLPRRSLVWQRQSAFLQTPPMSRQYPVQHPSQAFESQLKSLHSTCTGLQRPLARKNLKAHLEQADPSWARQLGILATRADGRLARTCWMQSQLTSNSFRPAGNWKTNFSELWLLTFQQMPTKALLEQRESDEPRKTMQSLMQEACLSSLLITSQPAQLQFCGAGAGAGAGAGVETGTAVCLMMVTLFLSRSQRTMRVIYWYLLLCRTSWKQGKSLKIESRTVPGMSSVASWLESALLRALRQEREAACAEVRAAPKLQLSLTLTRFREVTESEP